jgi:hypothetical protein
MPRTRQLEKGWGLVYVASVGHERELHSYHDKFLSWYGGTERPFVKSTLKSTFVPRQVLSWYGVSVATNVNYVRAELETVPRQVCRGMFSSSLEGFELGAEINGIVPRQKSFYLDKKGGLVAVCVAGNTCFTLVQNSWDRTTIKSFNRGTETPWIVATTTPWQVTFVPRLPYHDKTYGWELNYGRCPVCLGWVLRWCS